MKNPSVKLKTRKKRNINSRRKEKINKLNQRMKQRNRKKIVYDFMITIVITVFFVYIVSIFTFSIKELEGYSMMPTIEDRDWVYINKIGKLRRFKLVAYRDEQSNEIAVRRLIGLPGELLSYKNDTLYVNNQEIFERFLVEQVDRAKNNSTTYTKNWELSKAIPKEMYVVLGDNRPYATDSREYGFIEKKNIVGVVEMRLFPFHKLEKF